MRRNDNTIIVLGFLLLIFQSCSQKVKGTKMETYEEYRTQEIEARDSLFVLHTVKEWGRLNWRTWGVGEDLYQITQKEIEYLIGGTFYNLNKTRMLVWMGDKRPNAESLEKTREPLELNRICPTAGDTVYSMTALIGFRENPNTIWKLYPFSQKQAICCKSKAQAISILGQYYFGQMAEHKMYHMQQEGKKKGHRELEAYGYNLQDKAFWKKCWLWKKDNVGSHGLYPFQIKNYSCNAENFNRLLTDDPHTHKPYLNNELRPFKDELKECAEPYELPRINYPKEILDLYK